MRARQPEARGKCRICSGRHGVPTEAKGKAQGRLETLVSLWKKNRLTLQEAAEEAEMTVDEFVKKTGIKPVMN